MEKKGLEIGKDTYKAKLEALGSIKNSQSALQVLNEMKEKNIEMDTRTFNLGLDACRKDPQYGRDNKKTILNMFNDYTWKGKKLYPDIMTYNAMMTSTDDPKVVDDIWNTITKKTITPNLATYHILIDHLMKQQRIEEVFSLIGTMSNWRLKPDLRTTYHPILAWLIFHEDAATFATTIKIMDSMGQKWTEANFRMFLTFCKVKIPEEEFFKVCKEWQEWTSKLEKNALNESKVVALTQFLQKINSYRKGE
eukprot:TRINITY_DN10208_c0_g1_i1.p1 TRINITY_DN10208_c0_g1~~TRINITY_DN10208_c0_g1_i1.p1  ORF type:complete len:262 (+),score=72.99 TRINITY_DN10208_c0_g1_i1:35-787(+)